MSFSKSEILSLAAFLTIVVGGGIVIGTMTAPGSWYENLVKPSFNPPNWIFAPVWTVLYVFVAVTGWRLWTLEENKRAIRLWVVQLLLNFIWSPVFFGAELLGLALVIISGLLVVVLCLVSCLWSLDRLSAVLLIPYAMWVTFALMLNAAIVSLN